MPYTTVFKRCEIKYLLTEEQKARVLSALAPYIAEDSYGHTSIRNIYYDTDTYLLIRRSIEKPIFKEKLRLRSYGLVSPHDTVFAEIKRKYRGTVYKRRLPLSEMQAAAWMGGERPAGLSGQIASEIDYFLSYYETLAPRVFLSYERDAYIAKRDGLRVTFDSNVLARCEGLSLCEEVGGRSLLPEGMTLMELKCSNALPLYVTSILTREGIYKASFSKYGEAYKTLIFKNTEEDLPCKTCSAASLTPNLR